MTNKEAFDTIMGSCNGIGIREITDQDIRDQAALWAGQGSPCSEGEIEAAVLGLREYQGWEDCPVEMSRMSAGTYALYQLGDEDATVLECAPGSRADMLLSGWIDDDRAEMPDGVLCTVEVWQIDGDGQGVMTDSESMIVE